MIFYSRYKKFRIENNIDLKDISKRTKIDLKYLQSIEKGKLADLVILNEDPLDEIRNTNSVDMVMKNGRMYDGDNLNQIYPLNKKSKNFNWQEQVPRMLPGVKN